MGGTGSHLAALAVIGGVLTLAAIPVKLLLKHLFPAMAVTESGNFLLAVGATAGAIGAIFLLFVILGLFGMLVSWIVMRRVSLGTRFSPLADYGCHSENAFRCYHCGEDEREHLGISKMCPRQSE